MVQSAEGSGAVPRYDLGAWTVIHDAEENQAIMQLQGVVLLPIGARVELVEPSRDVYVVGARLLAPSPEDGAVYVCLDVSKDKPNC